MADLIIRGMEMPESCDKCSLFNECWCMALGIENWRKSYNKPEQGERLPDCPLVPLPDGHGRLIDADAFKADCLAATKEAKPDFIRREDWLKSCAVTMSFCRDIDERPTIVDREE